MECVFLIFVVTTKAKNENVLDNEDKKLVKNQNSFRRSRWALINRQELPVHTSKNYLFIQVEVKLLTPLGVERFIDNF